MPLELTLAGERIQLHGDRALFWPARERLLIADLHLGKGDTFRRAGIALPSGGTEHDLQRLSALIAGTGATSLWVLGDLLHGALVDSHWRGPWEGWRRLHGGIEIVVLTGNHDRALASAGLTVRLPGNAHEDGPFLLRHDPEGPETDRHVLCGHLHPRVALPGLRRGWPAFWLRPGSTVLPAFSELTGGVTIEPAPGDRLVACVEGNAIWAPEAPPRRARLRG